MDRNTAIGLVVIGIILSVFTIFNQPSEEELKAQKEEAKKEQEAKEKAKKDKKAEKSSSDEKEAPSQTLSADWEPKLDDEGNRVEADSGMIVLSHSIDERDTTVALELFEEPKEAKIAEKEAALTEKQNLINS